MKEFYLNYNLKSVIRTLTCFKNPETPSFTGLILTNFPNIFQSYCVVETALSHFYEMTVTVIKLSFEKLKPQVKPDRNYNFSSNKSFRDSITDELSKKNFEEN